MQTDGTRSRALKTLFVVVPVLALGVLLLSRGPSSINKEHLLEDVGSPAPMSQGSAFTSNPRPGQAGQEVPWHVLPEGSYTPPYAGMNRRPWTYAADAAVELPLSANTMFFTAQGAGLGGVLNINNDGHSGSDTVRVDVRMYYTASHLASAAKLLREQPAAGKHGLGIQTPMRCGQNENMFFDIRVHLPAGTAQSPQRINNLESNLPNFAHVLGDLANGVHFSRISLTGANDQISAKSLAADVAQIRTSNGLIEGQYTAKSRLGLNTDNGNINAEVTLVNGGGGATTLDLGSSNGEVIAAVSLRSSAQGGTGGTFEVGAQTSNGGVSLSFPEAPLDAVQRIAAESSIGDVDVRMHRAFEGTFSLSQSFPAPVVQYDARARDPAGLGRARSVSYQEDRRGAYVGRATWGENGRTLGNVKLQTSIGNTKLVL